MKRLILSRALALALGLTSAASAQLTIVDNIPGTLVDISGSGTPLGLGDDDEADIATTVGNSVFAAGTARVGNNGGVRFAGPGVGLGFTNAAIPSAGNFGTTSQVLDVFWDDVDSDTGDVYWQEIGGTLIVQWNDRPFFPNTPDHLTAQLQVHSSGPALAQFLYGDVEGARPGGGVSATIGYQDGGAGFNDVEWSFNTGGAVSNGTVLSLVTVGACDPCDMNCDGSVNAFDIEPFLCLLFGPCAPCDSCTGDVDNDGDVGAFDIDPFLNCLFP